MIKKLWAHAFERTNFVYHLTEKVWVVFETTLSPYNDEQVEAFENLAWEALWKQYPIWECPYHQGKHAPNHKEQVRHGFSSAFSKEFKCLS